MKTVPSSPVRKGFADQVLTSVVAHCLKSTHGVASSILKTLLRFHSGLPCSFVFKTHPSTSRTPICFDFWILDLIETMAKSSPWKGRARSFDAKLRSKSVCLITGRSRCRKFDKKKFNRPNKFANFPGLLSPLWSLQCLVELWGSLSGTRFVCHPPTTRREDARFCLAWTFFVLPHPCGVGEIYHVPQLFGKGCPGRTQNRRKGESVGRSDLDLDWHLTFGSLTFS